MRYASAVSCPFCKSGSLRTSDSRFTDGSFWCVARHRRCTRCKRTFQSFEILAEDYQHLEKYAVIVQGLRELIEPGRSDLPPHWGDPLHSVVQPTEKGKGK